MIKIIAETKFNLDVEYNKAIELIDYCFESGVCRIKYQDQVINKLNYINTFLNHKVL